MNLRDFCDLLYGDAERGWLTLNFFPAKETRWFQVGGDLPSIPNKRNVYLGLGIRHEKTEGRGKLEDIIGIPGFWLDLDYESDKGAHKTTSPLPSDRGALDLIERAPHPPTLVINSGHGYQAYWLFNEVWYFNSDMERQHAARLNIGWQSWFQTEAKRYGWHVDSTADLPRVFRVPGTRNYKTKPYREVHVVEEMPLRYEPVDFEEWIAESFKAEYHETYHTRTGQNGKFNLADIPHLSDRIKYLILHGDSLGRYDSRSEALFGAIQGLMGAGCADEEIFQIVTMPTHKISESPLEKGERWVWDEIRRAHEKAREPQYRTQQEEWRRKLLVKKNGDPTTNVGNIGLILAHHKEWHNAFWWDSVRGKPMVHNESLRDDLKTEIAQWLCLEERMSISNERPVENCIIAECLKHKRDLLQELLFSLPAWDGKKRLDYWLSDVTECTHDVYGKAVSRIIPLSMVARALNPGCLYRYVVILEGPENTGKSSLVRALAGQEWYVELNIGFETKEALMMIQGVWVAELAELDSMNRTEETRLKAVITNPHDSWIPKYSNFRIEVPRRTIFIGTTNDRSYLKGQTGNTRFLPIETHGIHLDRFVGMREQIFAEALYAYQESPSTWWVFPEDALAQAEVEREERRIVNVYEELLEQFLDDRPYPESHTSWQEIAEKCLRIEPGQWKDKSLQMQVSQALKTLGWSRKLVKQGGVVERKWVKTQ